jgi:hypothetical protein
MNVTMRVDVTLGWHVDAQGSGRAADEPSAVPRSGRGHTYTALSPRTQLRHRKGTIA